MTPARFSTATSFEDRLVDGLAGLPVEEVYGRLENDGFGGGRPRYLVPHVGRRRFEAHVGRVRAAGLRFNYLLNAADGCGDAATPAGLRRLRRLLDRIVEAGVEALTVASPFVLRVAVRHTPLKVRASVFARVADCRKARAWIDEGADLVVLDSMLVNRDPDRLRRIAAAVDPERLVLLLNNRCEVGCAWAPSHAADLAAASRARTPRPDACYLHCQARFVRSPHRYLAQDWIRPEDLPLYEAMGYRRFKISGRGCGTEDLLLRARAYAARRHDGDLMDLLRHGPVRVGPGAAARALLAGGPGYALGLLRLAREASALDRAARIENRALDGFLEEVFRRGGCAERRCAGCDVCARWAARAVRLDEKTSAAACERSANDLLDGDLWRLPRPAARKVRGGDIEAAEAAGRPVG